MRNLDTIVIHCTATPEGRPVSVDTIRSWHLTRGFQDIGYHFVIGLHGEIWPGRPLAIKGAHVGGHNTGSIGISYVGGVTNDGKLTPKDTRTPAQKAALLSLMRGLLADYPTIHTICGHRDFPKVAKACPCFDAIVEYKWLLTAKSPSSVRPHVQAPQQCAPDATIEPAFKPDKMGDEDKVVPAALDKPASRTTGFWERIFNIGAGGGLLGGAFVGADWKVFASVGTAVVVLAVVGLVFHQRIIKAVKAIKAARA